ncbi:hypothetical protein HMPREF0083_01645 [Aneurinibacillus aneurinilyticus ATCC 12856]|jgi:hypothetical protein|uniref:Uncharacterized protein n=1 Tax=Aneurinibacillus aneurinilyticus ATCC 12856 TaxID=649747 RepID=U1WNY8_ANEAE|nr:hypothetical protein HMPREF0083_01645 [Aneurinibacillus aneurinilyticus ATCC 12856]
MSVETVRLEEIISTVMPEAQHVLTEEELNVSIVLRDGLRSLNRRDVLEIVAATIHNTGKGALLH